MMCCTDLGSISFFSVLITVPNLLILNFIILTPIFYFFCNFILFLELQFLYDFGHIVFYCENNKQHILNEKAFYY